MTASTPTDAELQDRVFAFLTTHPGVHRIDTHAAAVFLDGPRALKIKRAVRFPYLDYSTLAKRKAACDEEIKVNRAFAPQIYHRVVPITQNAEGLLCLDGSGPPVEFAIEMTRFDEHQTFDHVAEAGEPDRAVVDAIADAIAASHSAAQLAPAEPWIKSIPAIIDDNAAAFRTAACFPASEVNGLEEASKSAFSRIRTLLEQRAKQGYVRRCHGDLHLANIVLIEHKPLLFDAIEFDPAIASVDVVYDLAFPMMDLLRYGRHAAANALLNRYLRTASFEHADALAALPLFMSLRAAIRAKVLLAQLGSSSRDKAEIIGLAQDYFELAQQLISPAAPRLVAVGGLSGTGKSVLARALAPLVVPQPGAVVLRSDVLRKQQFGINETDRLSEIAYTPEMTATVYQLLVQRALLILSQGHSVVVDAVFAQQAERAAVRDVARKLDIGFVGLFLQTDLATRVSRIGRRQRDASDATPEIAGLQERYDIGAIDWDIIDGSGTPKQTLELCQARIVCEAV